MIILMNKNKNKNERGGTKNLPKDLGAVPPEPATPSTALGACPRSARTLLSLQPLSGQQAPALGRAVGGRQGPRPSGRAGWGEAVLGTVRVRADIVLLAFHLPDTQDTLSSSPQVRSSETTRVSSDQSGSSREPHHVQCCWGCGGHCELWAGTGTS